MRVLVAGGTGFIGRHLCRELTERGHEVTALARDPAGADLPEGVETAMGDVGAYDSIAGTVADHDAVVNLVALSPLFEPPSGTTQEGVHLEGTANLLEAAEEGDTDRFVQMSGLGAAPDAPTAHLRAKGKAEKIVRDSELEWTIFRPSVVFGDDAEFLEFTKMVTTPYVTGLPGGGEMPFQPIYVGDLVGMLTVSLEEDDHVGETYEVGGPEVLTLADVTKLAYAAEGKSVTILPVPTALSKLGLTAAGPLPGIPFGPDQARALEVENTVDENDVSAFGYTEAELTSLGEYLGLERRPSSPPPATS